MRATIIRVCDGGSITGAELAAYQRDGVVCLRGLYGAAWVARMRTAIDDYLRSPGPRTYDLSGDHGGEYVGANFLWLDRDEFRAFVFDSPSAEIAATCMATTSATLYHDTILVKEPGSLAPTPWHQDRPYYPFTGEQLCAVWFALDPVTLESGSVEYVKASHRWGAAYHPERFGHVGSEEVDLPRVPDIDADRNTLDITHFDLAPGDCVVHHGMTVHGAPGNLSRTTRRRALVTRWLGDDIRYAGGPLAARHPIDSGLTPGDRPESRLFPLIWSLNSRGPSRSRQGGGTH